MHFLNLALIFEITKRSGSVDIIAGNIFIGLLFALLVFGWFQFIFRILRIPREHRFKALLVGANMAVIVLLYHYNYHTAMFSALATLNALIFIFKFKYLDK
ncbi:MAG: hypothetical protein AAB397_01520 [Patescibacteria group bacterium]